MIENGKVLLSRIGEIVRACWFELPNRFSAVQLDAFIVMPNHLHGVVLLVKPIANRKKGGASPAPTCPMPSLGEVVGAFKSLSTIAVNRELAVPGQQLWQRNYYEHVIRDSEDLAKIQRYIEENPTCWDADPENPKARM